METGKRFFSKDELFKYIKAGSSQADKSPPPNKDNESHAESTSSQVSHDIVSGSPLANEDSERHGESTSLQVSCNIFFVRFLSFVCMIHLFSWS